MDDLPRFRSDSPNFPTSPAAQALLAKRGQIANPSKMSHLTAAMAGGRPEQRVLLGIGDKGDDVGINLINLLAGRMLIQGMSGAGKSYTLRRLVEEASPYTTIAIVDPEGEFANLAEFIGAVSVKGTDLSSEALAALALRCREHRVHVHVDLSDLQSYGRIEGAAAFFSGLLSCSRDLWGHTVMVVIDEAHLLAPYTSTGDASSRRLGIAAMTDLCSRGRKRGLAPVIATQRLAKLAASVLAELQNMIIGINMLDIDIYRAADVLGWTSEKAGLLRDLRPGRFVCLGPAIAPYPTIVNIGATKTKHIGHTPKLMASAGLTAERARELLQVDQISTGRALREAGPIAIKGNAILDAFLLTSGAEDAVRIVSSLCKISPNATTANDLAKHLGLTDQAVATALETLSGIGAIESIPRGTDRIARLSARLRMKITTPVVSLS